MGIGGGEVGRGYGYRRRRDVSLGDSIDPLSSVTATVTAQQGSALDDESEREGEGGRWGEGGGGGGRSGESERQREK